MKHESSSQQQTVGFQSLETRLVSRFLLPCPWGRRVPGTLSPDCLPVVSPLSPTSLPVVSHQSPAWSTVHTLFPTLFPIVLRLVSPAVTPTFLVSHYVSDFVSQLVSHFVFQLVSHFVFQLVSHFVSHLVFHFVSNIASCFVSHCNSHFVSYLVPHLFPTVSLALSQTFCPTVKPTLSVILFPRWMLRLESSLLLGCKAGLIYYIQVYSFPSGSQTWQWKTTINYQFKIILI